MNIGIIGYGVMGQLVEKAAKERGHDISVVIDPENGDFSFLADIDEEQLSKTDVFIDFSTPQAAQATLMAACKFKKPVVMATTGWYDKMDQFETLVKDHRIGFVWGSNFSVGVNLFWQVLEKASALFSKQNDYDVFTHEFHHKRKKDSPSGTALTTAQKILNNHNAKNKIVTERLDRAIEPNELHVSSTRGGSVPGTHQVYFDSAFDTIELSHTARTRDGFAIGSILAAEWVKDKTGFYAFDEIFDEISK